MCRLDGVVNGTRERERVYQDSLGRKEQLNNDLRCLDGQQARGCRIRVGELGQRQRAAFVGENASPDFHRQQYLVTDSVPIPEDLVGFGGGLPNVLWKERRSLVWREPRVQGRSHTPNDMQTSLVLLYQLLLLQLAEGDIGIVTKHTHDNAPSSEPTLPGGDHTGSIGYLTRQALFDADLRIYSCRYKFPFSSIWLCKAVSGVGKNLSVVEYPGFTRGIWICPTSTRTETIQPDVHEEYAD